MQIINNTVRLASGPDLTKEVLESIGMVVEDLRSGRKLSAIPALNSIKQKNPQAGILVKDWLNLGISFASLMLTLAVAIKDWQEQPATNMSIDVVVGTTINQYYTEVSYGTVARQELAQDSMGKPLFKNHSSSDPDTKNRKQRRKDLSEERRNRR